MVWCVLVVRKIIAVGVYMNSSWRVVIWTELVYTIYEFNIGQLGSAADGANMRGCCGSCCKHRGSCITMCVHEEILRKTGWSSAVAQDVCLRFKINIWIDFISVHDVD